MNDKSRLLILFQFYFFFSPLIKAVNEKCSPEFKSYNKCINENTDQLHVCLDVLEDFNHCATRAAKEFTARQKTDK